MVVREMTQIHVLQNWQLFSLICSYNFRTILKTLTLQYSLIGSFLRNATSRTWLLPKMILPVCYAAQKNMPAKYHRWGNYRRSSGYPNSEENIYWRRRYPVLAGELERVSTPSQNNGSTGPTFLKTPLWGIRRLFCGHGLVYFKL